MTVDARIPAALSSDELRALAGVAGVAAGIVANLLAVSPPVPTGVRVVVADSALRRADRLLAEGRGDAIAPALTEAVQPAVALPADGRRRPRPAAGVALHINGGYRTYAEQVDLYARHQRGEGNLAACPDMSTHGWGLSADIDATDRRALHWLRGIADRFGFFADVHGEAWHWTYRPR